MTAIAVVDHGAGNLVSIAQGLRRAGATVTVAEIPAELDGADGVVLPGVGTTAAAMARLDAADFTGPLREWPGPLLGICVGLQLFFEDSAEDGAACLGLVPGTVERLSDAPLLPHIGWNDVATSPDPLFQGIDDLPSFYFVHSYAPRPADDGAIIGATTYGTTFTSAVRSGLRVGVQFHPERSGALGLRLLSNFVASCAEASRAA